MRIDNFNRKNNNSDDIFWIIVFLLKFIITTQKLYIMKLLGSGTNALSECIIWCLGGVPVSWSKFSQNTAALLCLTIRYYSMDRSLSETHISVPFSSSLSLYRLWLGSIFYFGTSSRGTLHTGTSVRVVAAVDEL